MRFDLAPALRTLALPLSAAMLVMAPLAASAQTVATSFEELQPLLKRGNTIIVTDANGRTTKGRLGELSSSSLELLVRKTGPDGRDAFVPQARLTERDVLQIRREDRDSLLNGTLIGMTPGAVIGVIMLFGGAGCDCYTVSSRAPWALLAFGIGGGIGAALGAGVDGMMVERPTVYLRPRAQRSAGVQLSPFVTKSAAGMQMSVRF
jgi:hypothetical protein